MRYGGHEGWLGGSPETSGAVELVQSFSSGESMQGKGKVTVSKIHRGRYNRWFVSNPRLILRAGLTKPSNS